MSDELSARLALACDAAWEAGRHVLQYFRRDDLKVDIKGDASPVTVADREAEQLLRRRIAAEFSHDSILGEEFGEQQGASGYRWILDPIDGTKSFIHGVPLFGCLIGLEHSGQSRLGVVHLPALDEMVYAAEGQGAWRVRSDQQPIPARVSKIKVLAESLFCTSGLTGFRKRGAWSFFERLTTATKLTRTWGDAYGYFLVATGQAELMVDPEMHIWDTAAVMPVIQEAGGKFTDWKGQPTIDGGNSIATNGWLHTEVLKLITGAL